MATELTRKINATRLPAMLRGAIPTPTSLGVQNPYGLFILGCKWAPDRPMRAVPLSCICITPQP